MKRMNLLRCITVSAFTAWVLPAPARADEGMLVHDSVIDPLAQNFPRLTFSLPTVHGVTFQQDGITTYKGWQYATYYQGNSIDSTGKVGVARRPLPNGVWDTLILDDYIFTTVDSHNDPVIGICPGDGSIHLSFDHHGDPLNYRVSLPGVADQPTTTAWSPALFGPVRDHLLTGGATMTSVTYPIFIPTPDGNLLFTRRSGSSSQGSTLIYEYDGATREWSEIGMFATHTGTYEGSIGTSTRRNSYFDNVHFGPDGRLHATWCWREPGGGSANHDLLYAYSDDIGRTWKNRFAEIIAVSGTSFITLDSPGILAWPIPQNRNYINNSAMISDRQGRLHVVAWHLPDSLPDNPVFDATIASDAVFNHYWRGTDGVWRKNETTLTGTRAKLVADDDDRLFLIYGDGTNVRIAAATPADDPETTPSISWADWAPLALSGALPEERANTVNTIIDPVRWTTDRIISVYAQETNISGVAPTALHCLDYHVSRAAAGPFPADSATYNGLNPVLTWHTGLGAISSDVYFGSDETSVAAATTASPEYMGRQTHNHQLTNTLQILTTYYWRVDSVATDGTVKPGRVWSFTVGDPRIAIAQQEGSRSYGGRATFSASLVIDDESLATADVTLYLGSSDGGTDPNAWQQAISLGLHPEGYVSTTLDSVPAGLMHYRFRATSPHRDAWAPASVELENDGDLSGWTRNALISFPGYDDAEDLTDFTVLVRLSPSAPPGFSYGEMQSPPYGDLRFSTIDGTVLPFEVESWDPAGTSLIWVKLPQLSAAIQLRVWWGKAGESPPSTSAEAWADSFNGVWHLDPTLGFATNSSGNQLAGTAVDVEATDGVIPGAAAFDGTSSSISIANDPALNPQQISVEAWIKTSSPGIVSIFGKDETGPAANRVWQFRLNAGKPEFIVFSSDTVKATVTSPDAINDDQFHHVCGTWDGTIARIHVDGLEKNSAALVGNLNPSQTNAAFIGRMQTSSPGYFNGTIDEVRLSSTARASGWIRATWENQKPDSTFIAITPAMMPDIDGDSLPDAWEISHFNTIFNTSPDFDSDGHVDLLEFALGTDPTSSSEIPAIIFFSASEGAAPEFIYEQIAGGSGEVGTTYTAAGLRYIAEISTDLVSWRSGAGHVTWSKRREPMPGGMERVGIHPHSSAPQIFARLRVLTTLPDSAASR